MTTLKAKSPAKINLTFKVLHKRADGYHSIETLMQAITLCDWVSLSFSERDQLDCSDPALPNDASNLAWKAVELFRCKTNLNQPLTVQIEKHIPAQAGLGGGSSNAATTLYLLNQLHGQVVDESTLQQWSEEIGSDTPFFFSSGTAFCKGRGEIVKDIDLLPSMPHYIAKPRSLHLSTAKVYAHCKSGESLEPAAFRVEPKLLEVKQQLELLGFEKVRMTGSGSGFLCYGNLNPIAEGIDFYPVGALRKKAGQWYT